MIFSFLILVERNCKKLMSVIYHSKSFFQTNWFTDDSVPPTIDGEIDEASFDRINWSARNSFKRCKW